MRAASSVEDDPRADESDARDRGGGVGRRFPLDGEVGEKLAARC